MSRFIPWVSALFAFTLTACGKSVVEPDPDPTFTLTPSDTTAVVENTVFVTIQAQHVISCRYPEGEYTADADGQINAAFGVTVSAIGPNRIPVSCPGTNGKTVTKEVNVRGIGRVEATLTASPDTVYVGDWTTLTRSCKWATSANRSWEPNTTQMEGMDEVTITALGKTTFSYICDGEGGSDLATVDVVGEPVPPPDARAIRNRPGEVPGSYLTQFVYMLSADMTDRGHDWNGQMNAVINAALTFFAGKTGRVPAVDNFGGRPDILFVQSLKTHAQLLPPGGGVITPLLDELSRRIGGLREKKKYIIFYPTLTSLGFGGSAVQGGAGGGVYSSLPEWDDALIDPLGNLPPFIPYGYSWIHEWGHVLGAVSPTAPNFIGGGHTPNPDVMCGAPATDCDGSQAEVDPDGNDWFGDNVGTGIFNAKLSPWLIPAPPELVAIGRLQAQALRDNPVTIELREFREELVLPPKRPQ